MHNTDSAAIADVVMWVSCTTLSAAATPRSCATKMTGVLTTPGAIGNNEITCPPMRTNHHGRLSEAVSGLTRYRYFSGIDSGATALWPSGYRPSALGPTKY